MTRSAVRHSSPGQVFRGRGEKDRVGETTAAHVGAGTTGRIGHRTSVGIEADDELGGTFTGAAQDSLSGARSDIDRHALVAVDQVVQLADVYVEKSLADYLSHVGHRKPPSLTATKVSDLGPLRNAAIVSIQRRAPCVVCRVRNNRHVENHSASCRSRAALRGVQLGCRQSCADHRTGNRVPLVRGRLLRRPDGLHPLYVRQGHSRSQLMQRRLPRQVAGASRGEHAGHHGWRWPGPGRVHRDPAR